MCASVLPRLASVRLCVLNVKWAALLFRKKVLSEGGKGRVEELTDVNNYTTVRCFGMGRTVWGAKTGQRVGGSGDG